MIYDFNLTYPENKTPESVSDTLRELLVPRKWRHFLRSEKNILINGNYRNFNELIFPNDKIEIHLDHVESLQRIYPPSGQLPDIVYEDENTLIINKPKGQKTHPNQDETNTALNDCATYLKRSPFIVHRLDMLTGGLLLVAKNPAVVPIFNRQLTNKTLKRDYLAQVDLSFTEYPLHAFGTINKPIGQDPFDKRKRMVTDNGLNSITHYQVLSQTKDIANLLVTLETGRTHQIRVHLSSEGMPIIGDPLYNPNFQSGQELQLIGYQLTFNNPFSFETKTVILNKKQ